MYIYDIYIIALIYIFVNLENKNIMYIKNETFETRDFFGNLKQKLCQITKFL